MALILGIVALVGLNFWGIISMYAVGGAHARSMFRLGCRRTCGNGPGPGHSRTHGSARLGGAGWTIVSSPF